MITTIKNKDTYERVLKINMNDEKEIYNLENYKMTEEEEIKATTIHTFAPLRNIKQIGSLVGEQSCGKTTTLKLMVKFWKKKALITENKNFKIAVLSINERDTEIESWRELPINYLYAIDSKLDKEPEEKLKIINNMIKDLNTKEVDMVIIDSLVGLYDILDECTETIKDCKRPGKGGYRKEVFRYIWTQLGKLKAKYIIATIILHTLQPLYQNLYADFDMKSDSSIVLESELIRMGIYNNINPRLSYTREAEYNKFRNTIIKELANNNYSIEIMKKFGAIDKNVNINYNYPNKKF